MVLTISLWPSRSKNCPPSRCFSFLSSVLWDAFHAEGASFHLSCSSLQMVVFTKTCVWRMMFLYNINAHLRGPYGSIIFRVPNLLIEVVNSHSYILTRNLMTTSHSGCLGQSISQKVWLLTWAALMHRSSQLLTCFLHYLEPCRCAESTEPSGRLQPRERLSDDKDSNTVF